MRGALATLGAPRPRRAGPGRAGSSRTATAEAAMAPANSQAALPAPARSASQPPVLAVTMKATEPSDRTRP